MTNSYRHIQRAPLCLLLYALALILMTVGLNVDDAPPLRFMFPLLSLLTLLLAASLHHLRVEDRTDRLLVSFGPIPLFRRSVHYEDIIHAEVGRTTILDGWGIHMSLHGGWVWNLWGRDCVVVHLKQGGMLRIGTDDAMCLATFLSGQIKEQGSVA